MSSRVGSCSAITIAPFTQPDLGWFHGAAVLFALSDVDISIEGPHLQIRSAAVDGAVNRTIDVYTECSTVAFYTLPGLTAVCDLHVEIGKDVTLIASKPHVGLDRRRQRDIDVAIERRKRHGSVGRRARKRRSDATVDCMRHDRATHVRERDRSVHVVDLELAFHVADGNTATVDH